MYMIIVAFLLFTVVFFVVYALFRIKKDRSDELFSHLEQNVRKRICVDFIDKMLKQGIIDENKSINMLNFVDVYYKNTEFCSNCLERKKTMTRFLPSMTFLNSVH